MVLRITALLLIPSLPILADAWDILRVRLHRPSLLTMSRFFFRILFLVYVIHWRTRNFRLRPIEAEKQIPGIIMHMTIHMRCLLVFWYRKRPEILHQRRMFLKITERLPSFWWEKMLRCIRMHRLQWKRQRHRLYGPQKQQQTDHFICIWIAAILIRKCISTESTARSILIVSIVT